MSLRLRLIVAGAALAIASTGAMAAAQSPSAGKALTPQQQRMADCNKQATGKKGDERKAFMSSCLKGQTAAAPAKQTQQEKMKSCNADASAKSLKGDARKSFMSTCLKGGAAASP
ncbi:PsiF family protein [Fulvimonas soli]|jgi:hypothetical protein|uniref:PsiF repeat-containing protein n=1 Tax=Fulvimonas soli TaxID=155197 RepID=A0A316IFU4_9GAMM|nr:PsiF family protein [Fulvimonas soli]PWK92161.1 psiF repeat-containing protein [Fulvimonas soli]TNY27882.1 phosphate starvation-inducible protein PsiF [Fulvimonas soli]